MRLHLFRVFFSFSNCAKIESVFNEENIWRNRHEQRRRAETKKQHSFVSEASKASQTSLIILFRQYPKQFLE